MVIVRATTPIQTFIFDHDPSDYVKIRITYTQGGYEVLEKEKEDLTIEEVADDFSCSCGKYRAWFRMTQEETRKFRCNAGKPVYVQVRVLTEDGEALTSNKQQIQIQESLDDEVLR